MAEIAVLLTANETALLSALARVEAKNKQLEQGFHKTAKASGAITDHLKAQVATIATMATGYLSVNSAIRLITGTLKEKEELEKKSAAHAIGLAEPQAAFLWQLGAKNQEKQVAALKRIEAIAAATKPTGGIATVLRAGTAAMQATGGEDFESAMKATQTALKFAPQAPEAAIALAGLVPDIAKMTGGGEKENLALILKAKKLAHTKDIESLSSELLPTIMLLGRKGATPEEAVALPTAIQQALPGSNKRAVRGVVNELVAALEKELPEKDVSKWDERGRKQLVTKGTGLKTPIEQLEYLRKNQEAAQKFMGKAGLGEPAAGITEELLGMGTGQAWKFYQRGLKEPMPDVEQQMALVQRPFEQRVGAVGRGVEHFGERLQESTKGKEMALEALAPRAKIKELLAQAGMGFVERELTGFEALAKKEMEGAPPEEIFGEAMRRTEKSLRKPVEAIGWGITNRSVEEKFQREAAAREAVDMPKRLEMADIMRENTSAIVEEMRLARLATEEGNRQRAEGNAETKKQYAQPNAAAAQGNLRQHGAAPNF
jgi:hypothetical protein